MGYFLGDGFIRITPKTRIYQLMFAEPLHGRYRSYYAKLLRKIFGKVPIYESSKEFGLISRPVTELFHSLDLHKYVLDKRVPEWVFELPTSQKLALIEGYCDADGHRRRAKPLFRRSGWMSFESPNKLLIQDLRTLCIMAGLRVTNLNSRTRTIELPSGRTHTSEFWSFEASGGSRSSKYGAGMVRGDTGLDLMSDYVGFERVTKITRLGRQQVYDLEVEGNENFIADGTIVHNTSDAPLTVFQSLPLDGVIVVSSPQDLAVMVVKKAMNMARHMDIPILGLIENMSYIECPKCGENIELYGPSKGAEVAEDVGIQFLGKIPVDPKISTLSDQGRLEDYSNSAFTEITRALRSSIEKVVKETEARQPIAWSKQ